MKIVSTDTVLNDSQITNIVGQLQASCSLQPPSSLPSRVAQLLTEILACSSSVVLSSVSSLSTPAARTSLSLQHKIAITVALTKCLLACESLPEYIIAASHELTKQPAPKSVCPTIFTGCCNIDIGTCH